MATEILRSAKTVLIASRLPNGLILKHPDKPSVTVRLDGVNSSKIIGATFMTTEVDVEFWETWKTRYAHETSPYEPLASGAIFEASNEARALAIAKEYSKRKTGLEKLEPTAHHVKPADKD